MDKAKLPNQVPNSFYGVMWLGKLQSKNHTKSKVMNTLATVNVWDPTRAYLGSL